MYISKKGRFRADLLFDPIAQRIEHGPSKPVMIVRIYLGPQMS